MKLSDTAHGTKIKNASVSFHPLIIGITFPKWIVGRESDKCLECSSCFNSHYLSEGGINQESRDAAPAQLGYPVLPYRWWEIAQKSMISREAMKILVGRYSKNRFTVLVNDYVIKSRVRQSQSEPHTEISQTIKK